MRDTEITRISTISQYHKMRGLNSPDHPLISVIYFEDMKDPVRSGKFSLLLDLYAIALKRGFQGKMKYGQQEYDFDEGVLSFIGPGQLFSIDADQNKNVSGFLILFHPDLLWNSPLAGDIRKFEFFNYSLNEALFLSEKEEELLTDIKDIIEKEYKTNTDRFSHDLITR